MPLRMRHCIRAMGEFRQRTEDIVGGASIPRPATWESGGCNAALHVRYGKSGCGILSPAIVPDPDPTKPPTGLVNV